MIKGKNNSKRKILKSTIKKLWCGLLAATVIITEFSQEIYASDKEKGVADYTYTITPLLAPFNEYFFVKTDNPDPTSFRFLDKSSKYSESSLVSFDEDEYADVKYENQETRRVNGGYIFKSYTTDGGEIVLQSKNEFMGYVSWSDTNIKINLPDLKDEVDYLIDTYATEKEFFDNMDAVQSGFSSICLYSGSYIRGELYRGEPYWGLSTSPHIDQTFYIQSYYGRENNQSLFASSVYPFRHDSLGFPSVMARVSQRLDSSSSYEWSGSSHAYIHVTYGGETYVYGGAGTGKGQGITKDKIKQYFTFGTNGTAITLENCRRLLDEYAAIEMSDDVPRTDALTWENVCNTVDHGAWVRLTKIGGTIGGIQTGYTYLYKKNDGTKHSASVLDNGSEVYWGGDMGYFSDVWVDGRYIDAWEGFVRGAKFEEHPTSDIMLTDVTIPQIPYDYTGITEEKKDVLFTYDKDEGVWKASNELDTFNSGCAVYYQIEDMVEKGAVDEKYLDMVTLTLDEVKLLEVDKNTNIVPQKGYIYDATAEPGTPYELLEDVNGDGEVDIRDSALIRRYLAGWEVEAEMNMEAADVDDDGVVTIKDSTLIRRKIAGWE